MLNVLIINKVRFLLNSIPASQFYDSTVYSQVLPSVERLSEVSAKVLQLLSTLIYTPRKKVDVIYPLNSYKRNVVKRELLIQSDSFDNQQSSVLPLHN